MLLILFQLLVLSEAGSPLMLGVPFCFAVVAQVCRAARLPGSEGLPAELEASRHLRRWHIAALAMVVLSIVSAVGYALYQTLTAEHCTIAPFNACGVFTDLPLVFAVASIPFALLYLGRMQGSGMPRAGQLAFGVWAAPPVVSSLTFAWSVDLAYTVAVVLGVVGYLAAAIMPISTVRSVILCASCSALMLTVGAWNWAAHPVMLLAGFAVGYAIYRIEWKSELPRANSRIGTAISAAGNQLNSASASGLREFASGNWARVATWLATVGAGVVVMSLVVGLGGEWLTTGWKAMSWIGISTLGAVVYYGVSMRWLRCRDAFADTAAVWVCLVAAGSVLLLIDAPLVKGVTGSTGVRQQYWKLVLGGMSLVGAVAFAAVTLTGWMPQVRPFLLSLIWPAALLLQTQQGSYLDLGIRIESWSAQVLATATTAVVLWMMWYVFGPGRRRRAPELVT